MTNRAWGVLLVGSALAAAVFLGHSCADADSARLRAEAKLKLAEDARKSAADAADAAVKELRAVQADAQVAIAKARGSQAQASRRLSVAERDLATSRRRTGELTEELNKFLGGLEKAKPWEVSAAFCAEFPGLAVPGPGDSVTLKPEGQRKVMEGRAELVYLDAIARSQRTELAACGSALEAAKGLGSGYLGELDAVRVEYDAAVAALSKSEEARLAAMAEVQALRAMPKPRRWKGMLVSFGAGALVAGVALAR